MVRKELKYVLLGLLATTAMFALTFAFVWAVKYYNEAVLIVGYLGLSYWASRMIRSHYES